MALNPQVLDKMLGVRFDLVDTSQLHALGIEIDCDDGTKRKYVRAGSGSIAQFDALTNDFGDASGGLFDYDSTTAASQPVHGTYPLAAAPADNNFFWMIIRGTAVVKAATVVAGTQLVSTATRGTLDDTAASAANALAMAAGVGVAAITADGTPAAGQARVLLS